MRALNILLGVIGGLTGLAAAGVAIAAAMAGGVLSAMAGTVLLAILGGVLLALVIGLAQVFKRSRRGPAFETVRPGPEWTPTAERFVDQASGRTVTVFFNPRTGGRRYVAE